MEKRRQVLLCRALIATSEKIRQGALLIEGERISKIWYADGQGLTENNGEAVSLEALAEKLKSENAELETVSLDGKVIMAGGIDAHVHFREPGIDFNPAAFAVQTCDPPAEETEQHQAERRQHEFAEHSAELHAERHALILDEKNLEPIAQDIEILTDGHIGLDQNLDDLVNNHKQYSRNKQSSASGYFHGTTCSCSSSP